MENGVQQKFNSYPDHIKPMMNDLRDLIYEAAKTTDGVGMEETEQ